MSQSSARSALFLQEMGVGAQWKLRQGSQEQVAVDSEPVPQAIVAPEPQAAPPAPAFAPAPAVTQPEAVSVATLEVVEPEPKPVAVAQASAPAAALEDESTAWFDDAPMPSPSAAPARPARPVPVSDEAIAQMDWDALRAAVATCTRCTLCETRRAAVNGRGAERASWIAIATAPSQQDEEAGEPVTAEAGQLLNNMLKAIELKPDSEVYVATLVKCHPVDRSPSADEVIACRPFLERELALTGATMAMTFGQFAAKGLMMGPAARGKVMHYGANQLPVVATYHPDDLLRKPEDKAKAWADLCLAKASHA